MARDARYDGKFFVAVKTTKIYCRPICPAPSPKEHNVIYYDLAIQAQEAGFRPCRRCRPESAPQSAAWIGTQAVLNRAISKIQAGALNNQKLAEFCQQLGISERYLRKLFQDYMGTSPLKYANHVRLMFAKQLLHQTKLPITDIAFSAGFNSIRRFNDAFKKSLRLTPSDIRNYQVCRDSAINIQLHYQGNYNWPLMQSFLKQREVSLFEQVEDKSYQRTFQFESDRGSEKPIRGQFYAEHKADNKAFDISIKISDPAYLMPLISKIKTLLDINANTDLIESHLAQDPKLKPLLQKGLRLPACFDSFEAGVKAILGQQVSIKAAYGHSQKLVANIGHKYNQQYHLFPTPQQIANADLSFLKMPASRKATLKAFANWYLKTQGDNLESILEIKGIGPWTLEYIKLRSGQESDAFPENDLVVQKALKHFMLEDTESWRPWRSYATLQLWEAVTRFT